MSSTMPIDVRNLCPLLVLATASAVGLALAGCSGRPETIAVSGTVRYEGRPLPLGEIRFEPIVGTAGPANGARIVEGDYAVTARGGILPGRYRVAITSRVPPEPALAEEGAGPPAAKLTIPRRYNSESTLEADFASGSGEVVLDFDLTAGE